MRLLLWCKGFLRLVSVYIYGCRFYVVNSELVITRQLTLVSFSLYKVTMAGFRENFFILAVDQSAAILWFSFDDDVPR